MCFLAFKLCGLSHIRGSGVTCHFPLSLDFLGLRSQGLLTSCCPCSLRIQDPFPGMCDDMGLSLMTWCGRWSGPAQLCRISWFQEALGSALISPSAGRKQEGWTASRVVSQKVPTAGGPLGNCFSPRAAFRSLSLGLSPQCRTTQLRDGRGLCFLN